jgi:hypothetical protein
MVANPMLAALQQLYSRLLGDEATLSNALKPASQQMAAGDTWVGPPARAWGSQLDGHARDCATQVNVMLALVEQAMQGLPAQVTEQEAGSLAKLMSLTAEGF